MSVAAVMVARDEADIVEATVRHALWYVDELICADHRSIDGTRDILAGLPVTLFDVTERGFDGDSIWTWLAREAHARGHDWLLVNDADDIWHVNSELDIPVREYLATLDEQVLVVSGDSTNQIPTSGDDDEETNPVLRIVWRDRDPDAAKVACRLRPDFSYGRHGGWYGGVMKRPDIFRGLAVRHFTIRTAEQLVRKVRDGMDGMSVEAGMPEGFDESWGQWKGLTDDDIRARFYERFWSDDPDRGGLVYDPAPWRDGLAVTPE